jgi:hypothetical protein
MWVRMLPLPVLLQSSFFSFLRLPELGDAELADDVAVGDGVELGVFRQTGQSRMSINIVEAISAIVRPNDPPSSSGW